MASLLTKQSINDEIAFVDENLRLFTDPYDTVRFMWQQRRDALQKLYDESQTSQTAGEVALLFEGLPVRGSEDINVAFSSRILDNYQTLISVLVAEAAGKELGPKGPVPRSYASQLFIRDMLRGSVGFLLQEKPTEQASLLPSPIKAAIDEATHTFSALASEGESNFQERIDALSPRAVGAIKKIAKTLKDAGAETRIVGDDEELRLGHKEIATIYERLSAVELVERTDSVNGMLLGLFPDKRQYEFRIGDEGPVIYGPVSEELDKKYLLDPNYASSILLKPIAATFSVLTKLKAGNIQSEERILVSASLREPPLTRRQ